MSKKIKGIITVFLLALVAFALFSCKDKTNYTYLVTNKMQYVDNRYYIPVSNATDNVNLNEYFTVDNDHAQIEISSDNGFNNKLDKENLQVEAGENVFYIKIVDENKNTNEFSVVVYRKHLYTVTFNSNGGTECTTQFVEEGGFASAPASIKSGYDLSWDYDFKTPINSDITINAVWSKKEEDKNFEITFSSPGTDLDGKTQSVIVGEKYALPIPTKKGYVFLGWKDGENSVSLNGTWIKNSNATLVAVFETEKYDIIYSLNGGTNNSENQSEYTIEDNIILKNPEKEGYIFDGWYEDIENKIITNGINKGSTGNKTFYAKWKKQVTITLDSLYIDKDLSVMTVIYGQNYTLPTPIRDDYIFLGWYNGDELIESSGNWMTEENVSLTAHFAPAEYGKIHYVLNGGVNSDKNPENYNVETIGTELTNPTREGYIFDGWYTDITFNESSKITAIPSENSGNITIYAKWKKQVTIIFDADGTDIDGTDLTVIVGEEYSLSKPNKDYYTFLGWKTKDGVSVEINGLWSIAEDTVLIADFSADNYRITYILEGGVNAIENKNSYNIESEKIVLAAPTKQYFIFGGWYLSSDFSDESKITEIVSGSHGEITLYAKWEPSEKGIVEIVYNANGGVITNDRQVVIAGMSYELIMPERLGYNFNGWYYNDNLIENSGIWTIESNVKLVAKWEIDNYNIEYDLNGGTYDGETIKEYNVETETFYIDFVPKKEGYIFLGWSENGSSGFSEKITVYKGSTENKKFVAKWFKTTAANGLIYSYDNGYATVIGYDRNNYLANSKKILVIPETYCEVTVTTIGNDAFNANKGLSFDGYKLTIPKSISRIGTNAFQGCTGMEIYMPISVDDDTKKEWAANAMVETGNKDVIDVILGNRPAIGWSSWIN